jgi:succinyl-diaminopimelate desuccinylase
MDPLIHTLLCTPSISPKDLGCQKVIADTLSKTGFECCSMPFGDIDNLWATYGNSGPTLLFAGHTDVVPPGPKDDWAFDPFIPTVHEGKLYARGAADMKIALCCMVLASKQFIRDHPHFPGRIAFLVTGCEEITTEDGTKAVITKQMNHGEQIDWCVVGEASSVSAIGDQIKIGRRGSLSGDLTLHGKQGHIAYPHSAINPIHKSLAALDELSTTVWDNGNEFFEPTSFQISNLHAGVGANNIIPKELKLSFNFRHSSEVTHEQLMERLTAILTKHHLEFELDWTPSGQAFITKKGKLINATKNAIQSVMHHTPKLDTGGGTSDARFIAPFGIETIELGFCHASIHQANEHVEVKQIEQLKKVYYALLEKLFL